MKTPSKTTISLYRVTCIISGKKYIGITKGTVEKRWSRHNWKYCLEKKGAFQRAIKKYGKENFIVEHLCEIFKETDAFLIERAFILEEGTMSPGGYNMTSGGETFVGTEVSEETRLKRSLAQKGKLGRKHSEETKELIGNLARGRKLSEEARRNIGNGARGRKHTQEAKDKMSAAKKGRVRTEEHKALPLRVGKFGIKGFL